MGFVEPLAVATSSQAGQTNDWGQILRLLLPSSEQTA